MKKIFIYSTLAALTGLGFSSCKNDLDVLSPGEESVSVYAILNPNEPTQYVRINKVYITDGDALQAAQDPNQINYGAGELQVTLERYMAGSNTPTLTTVGNSTKKSIVLTETVVTTPSGNFNQQQRIWITNDKLFSSGEYKLNILNIATGKTFYSQSLVVDSVKTNVMGAQMPYLWFPSNPLSYPQHGSYPASPTNLDKPKYINYAYTGTPPKLYLKVKSIPNAKLYRFTIRLHYIDTLFDNSAQTRYADISFDDVKSTTLNGGEDIEVSFMANEFYDNLAKAINSNPVTNVKSRKTDYLEYIVEAGAQSLYEFLQVNAPSNTIAQDKPLYSNINGGVGVFSTRSKTSVTKDLWNDFIDKIACHPSTQPLLFCNSAGQKVAVPCN